MLKIVIPCGAVEDYIGECLDSLIKQDVQDWHAIVVCDPCGDRTYDIASSYTDTRISVIKNEVRQYQMKNLLDGIVHLNPSDDDVIVTVDGDDKLFVKRALTLVKEQYDKGMLVTHGSFVTDKNQLDWVNKDISKDPTPIRQTGWHTSHLRTFKYSVFKHIKDESFRDSDGNYLRGAADQAVMIPLIELAGKNRVGYIRQHIYFYRLSLSSNLHNMADTRDMQTDSCRWVRSQAPYIQIFS